LQNFKKLKTTVESKNHKISEIAKSRHSNGARFCHHSL
jgi:hypothetical protein